MAATDFPLLIRADNLRRLRAADIRSVFPRAVLVRLAATLTPVEITSLRMLLAALLVGCAARAAGERQAFSLRTWLRLSPIGVTAALHFLSFIASLSFTTVAHALTLTYTAPLLIAALSRVVLKEALPRRTIPGAVVALAGIAVLAGFEPRLGGRMILGDLLALGAAATFAVYSVLGRRERARLPLLPYAAAVCLIAGLVTCPFLFLVFFSPKRREGPPKIADLKAAADRVEGHLNRKLLRLASPYLGTLRRVTVGFSLAFYNPLVMPERLVSRLVEEAWSCVHVLRAQRDLQNRCLQEVLLADQLSTVFQPVVELRRRRVPGYEALSRRPAGSVYQMPQRLFDMAREVDLVFELDRKCRRRALASAAAIPAGAKLFVNVFPSAMYDPEFQGASLVALVGSHGLTPDRVVLEITEREAIENYEAFCIRSRS